MPVSRTRHLQPVEDPASVFEDASPQEPVHPPTTISPVEDECFSEWLAVERQASHGEASPGGEPRWEEPPARLLERLASRVRPKRTAR